MLELHFILNTGAAENTLITYSIYTVILRLMMTCVAMDK